MHVVMRADGGATIGLGHVVRCLALAGALAERGARVTFLTRAGEPAVLARLAAGGFAVAPVPAGDGPVTGVPALLERAAALGARAAVVDVHGLTVDEQAAIRAAGLRLTVIDDLARGRFVADVVLNQNADARPEAYAAAPHTRLLLGPRYALLRPAFVGRTAAPPAGRPRVLLTMGGADPDNVTLQVLRQADALDADFALDVVLGPAFAHGDAVAAAARAARHPVAMHRDPGDLAGLMAGAALALSAAGTTCWELAHLGVPAVLVVLADNQAGNAAGLAAAGFALSLGVAARLSAPALREALAALLADPARRARMAAAGRRLVDGGGAARVAAEVLAA
jgi:UDP-2,4-diacetamido-2,4,6-trideoxy-beta-L-altropyranose hydrolase